MPAKPIKPGSLRQIGHSREQARTWDRPPWMPLSMSEGKRLFVRGAPLVTSTAARVGDRLGETREWIPEPQYDFLEFILQTELQLAIGQVGAGDFPEITIAEESVRIRELRCVKRIEKLRTKLQRMIFVVGHLESLAQ